MLTLIDWQCPAIGDPCLDLALFLSPTMQQVNGKTPLSGAEVAAFLEAYDNPQVTCRYHAPGTAVSLAYGRLLPVEGASR